MDTRGRTLSSRKSQMEEGELKKPNKPNDLSPETLEDPITHKKHAAMLDRLSNLHQSRLQHSQVRQSAADSSFESVESFLSQFSEAKRSLEADLLLCRSFAASYPNDKSQIKLELDKVCASISDLEIFVSERSYFLPPYDLRSSLNSIGELKEMVESANAEIAPRKKFAFKAKASSSKKESVVIQNISVPDSAKPIYDVKLRNSPGFRSRRGETLVKNFSKASESEGDFSLENLESCSVYLKGRFRALFVHQIKDCRIFGGPVLGSIFIEEVKGCSFMLASHQIRIHEARDSDFYLRVRSRPIVEDCNGVRFAPYRLFYDGIEKDLNVSGLADETGNWSNVDDFRWLRAIQSPNWCLIPKEEFVDVRNISEMEEKYDDEKPA